jgi:hypothetical protein
MSILRRLSVALWILALFGVANGLKRDKCAHSYP